MDEALRLVERQAIEFPGVAVGDEDVDAGRDGTVRSGRRRAMLGS
jgi:hypothetical protein